MERFIKGDVVVIPFPYSDLTNAKRRPALVLAESSYDDLILCQITSQTLNDASAINLPRVTSRKEKYLKSATTARINSSPLIPALFCIKSVP